MHFLSRLFTLPFLLIALSISTAQAENPFSSLNELNNSVGLDGGLGGDDEILEPDQAFQLKTWSENGRVFAEWVIADGHYMYRDKTKIQAADASLSTSNFVTDTGELKHDEFFGDIYVFHHTAKASLAVDDVKDGVENASFKVKYQGCSEISGICYPPITKDITLNISPISNAAASTLTPPANTQQAAPVSEQDEILNKLLNGSIFDAIIISFGLGILIAFTACMYPMIPILSSIIVGQGEKITTGKAFTMSFIYVQGMAITFGITGLIIALIGENIGIQAYFQNPALLIPFAILFVILALSMFGFYNIQIPSGLQSKLNNISNQQKGGSFIGVAIMGVLSALIIGPCGGPMLVAELAYASTATPINGFLALFAFGNGMGLPLLVIGTTGGKFLPKAGSWMDSVKAGAGVILLGVAIIILERMPSIFPVGFTMMAWASLLIISGIYIGALEQLQQEATGWKKLWKGIGIIAVIYGIIVIIGGTTGGSNVLDPMHGSSLTAKSALSSHAPGENAHAFKQIKTIDDLNKSIADATSQKKSVMLDFYADWCGYCKTLEAYVFPDPSVQAALKNTVLLQADVTDMDESDKELLKSVGIPLPPGLVFFNSQGKELTNYKVVGEITAEQLANHINKAFNSNSGH